MSFQIIKCWRSLRYQILFIYCVFPALSYSQEQLYTPKVRLAIETYAFLKGQSSALQMVTMQFPSLKPEVAAAEKGTKVLFERAERNIERFLKNELNDSNFNIVQSQIDSLLNEKLINPIEKEKHARDFLEKVRNRSRFTSDTLTKEIISFAYYDAPHQEIKDGHIQAFSTKGHPKAKGAVLKLSIPKSWLPEEAEMPETVQQFTSCYGKGNETILILIYDLPSAEFENLDEKLISEMIPPQAKLIRTEKVTIDGRPAMMSEVEETLNHNKMKVRMLQFMFTQKRKLYCIQGSIGPVKASENLEPQLKKYEPLFRLIASQTELDN
jgi:hypothetical protein